MASMFEKAYNKFAKAGSSINRGVNKVIGKEVFKDIKQIEEPRDFPPLDSYPAYTVPEPEQFPVLTGECKEFSLEGNVISVSANLDVCMQYREYFRTSAQYYMERFKFKYQNCVQDFDSFVYYSSELYVEGLLAMVQRAYSLLLPFGVFTADVESFTSRHIATYNNAINSYETMAGIEMSKNQAASNLGNQVGSAVQMQGGGFGLKGAMKGMAKAETFNLGMNLFGKYVAHQNRMSQEEKAKVYAAFNHEIFYQEVYNDYCNTFLTMVQTLAENGMLDNVTTIVSAEVDTMVRNLQNPMFPQDKMASSLVKLISSNPFVPVYYQLLQQKFGQTEEVNQIINYFVG